MTNQTIPEIFFARAKQTPKKTALLSKKDGKWRSVSYGEMARQVRLLAGGLAVLGVQKGDRVAILSENRPEWAIADLAIMSLGAMTTSLHTTYNHQAIANLLVHCSAKILVVSNSELLKKVLDNENELPLLSKIIFIEAGAKASDDFASDKIIAWQKVLDLGQNQPAKKIALASNDTCSVVYTSGTTGQPKGVLLSHYNFLSNSQAITSIIAVSPRDVFLSFLPLSHVLERLAGYCTPLLLGCTIAYAQSPKHLPANLKEIKPTILIAVPRIFEKTHDAIWDKVNAGSKFKKKIFLWALKQKNSGFRHIIADFLVFRKIRAGLGGRLRLTISGGAVLNEKIARFFYKVGIKVLEGYGLTETSPVVAVNRENDFKFGSVGKAIPGVQIKIAPDKEILVKGSNVFGGYYKNDEATIAAFDSEGWFKTGDLGFLDKDGFLTIIGRRKEMLALSGGKNIWPETLESEINKDRFITSSMVLGDKQPFVGALIVPDWQEVENFFKQEGLPYPKQENLLSDKTILALFQKRLDEKINPNFSDYERIKKFKLLLDDFSQDQGELTPTLKLRRSVIAQRYHPAIVELFGR